MSKCAVQEGFTRSAFFSWFSLLLRERAMVAAGHLEMCVSKLRSRDRFLRFSTKFCRLDDKILSEVGRKLLLHNGA